MGVAVPQALGGHPGIRGGTGAGVVWGVALTTLAAILAFATFQGMEQAALGTMVAGAVLATVVVQPPIGILMLMANYLVASYPSPIRGDGLITINNILGVILLVMLIAALSPETPPNQLVDWGNAWLFLLPALMVAYGSYVSMRWWRCPKCGLALPARYAVSAQCKACGSSLRAPR